MVPFKKSRLKRHKRPCRYCYQQRSGVEKYSEDLALLSSDEENDCPSQIMDSFDDTSGSKAILKKTNFSGVSFSTCLSALRRQFKLYGTLGVWICRHNIPRTSCRYALHWLNTARSRILGSGISHQRGVVLKAHSRISTLDFFLCQWKNCQNAYVFELSRHYLNKKEFSKLEHTR